MASVQQRIADAYIMVNEDPDTISDMRGTLDTLQAAVDEAGGNPSYYSAVRLNEMTALELIAIIAPNGIRFTR